MATGNTNWESDDEDDPDNEGTQSQEDKTAKGLRSHARKVDRENQELKTRLAEFETAARKGLVEKAVTAKGYDPMVVELVPDSVASDEAALEKWLSERDKLFGKAKQEEAPVEQGTNDDGFEDGDGWTRMQRVSASALPATKQADTLAAIKNAKSREELSEVLRGFGNPYVS